MQVQDHLESYLDYVYMLSHSNSTRKSYRSGVLSFREFLSEKHGLNEFDVVAKIKGQELDVYALLREFVISLDKEGYAPSSIRGFLAIVKGYLRYLGIKIYAEDCKYTVKVPKPVTTREEPLTKEMLVRLLRNLTPKLQTVVLVAVATGMRIGEIVQLRIADVEFGHFQLDSCSNQHSRCNPMIGGILISDSLGGSTLTVGDSTTGGKKGFVMSGHAAGCGTTGAVIYQATAFDGHVGTVITNPSGSRNSDSAFVEFDKDGSGNYLYTADNTKIYSGPNTSYAITAKQDGAADGTAVSMTGFGEQALESGVIQSHGVQVTDCGSTLSNQFLASYTHAAGDSGAPVFTTPSGGTTTLVGIHVGDLTVGSVSHAVFSGFGSVKSELGVN